MSWAEFSWSRIMSHFGARSVQPGTQASASSERFPMVYRRFTRPKPCCRI